MKIGERASLLTMVIPSIKGKNTRNSSISHSRHSSPAFTLVELLIVIIVIAILAAITIVAYNGITNQATAAALQSNLSSASRQVSLFYAENGTYPIANDCSATPAANTVCLKAEGGLTYEYVAVNDKSPAMYCITAISGSVKYYRGNDGVTKEGDCLDYGLIAYLDAGNPASYSGSGTTWTDLSGNGNHGTLTNGVGYSTDGGGSLVFDGTNDYVVSSSSHPYVDVVVIFQPDFTYAAQSSIAGLIASGTNTDRSLRFLGVNGTGPWTIPNPGNGNDWANSATTYYRNGVVSTNILPGWNIISGYRTNQNPFPSSFAYHIGSGLSGRYFKGKVASVLLFDRPLANSEREAYFERFRGRFGL